MAKRIKILSYGGGLDSFAMLLDAIDRKEFPDWAVFADTGSGGPKKFSTDGEWTGTYKHLRDYSIPLMKKHGIKFKWITDRDSLVRGEPSLLEYFEELRIIPNTRKRYCSDIAKIERIEQWAQQKFGKTTPLEFWIGFDADDGRHRSGSS